MKDFRKSKIALVLVLVMVVLVIADQGRLRAKDNSQITLSNGIATMVVGTKSLKLTEVNTALDAGFSSDGTVWVLAKNNWIFWYNNQYEGENNIGLHVLDEKVEKLTKDTNGDVIGYVKNGQNQNLLTNGQIKDILEYGGSKFIIPYKIGATPIRAESFRVSPTITTNVSQTAKPVGTSTLERNRYSISFKQNKGKTVLTLNGVEYELTETSVTEDVGLDKNGTLVLLTKTTEGGLLLWYSPAYQSLNNISLYILDSDVTSLKKDSYNRVVGYVKNGTKEFLTENELLAVINNNSLPQISELPIKSKIQATSVPETTAEPKTKIDKETSEDTNVDSGVNSEVYANTVISKGTTKILKNANGKRVDKLILTKKGVLKYRGLAIKKVKVAAFNSNGNVVFITKKGALNVINQSTLKKRTIKKKNMKKFSYNSKGIAIYAVKKGKGKIKLSSY